MGLNSWLRGKKQTGPSEITNLVHRMFAGTWATLTGPSEFLLGDRIGCDPLLFCVYADFDYGVTVAGMRFAEAYVPKDERDSVLFDFLQSFKNDLTRKNPALATEWLKVRYIEPNLLRPTLNEVSRIGYSIAVRWFCRDGKESDSDALLNLSDASDSPDNLFRTIKRLSEKYPLA